MASKLSDKDLRADAQNFCDSLGNVFMMKRRDPQTQHLLEKAKSLIEMLLAEKRVKSERPPIMPKPSGRGGSMGQLWVKMEELKKENEDLKRRALLKKEDKSTSGKSQGPGEVIIGELHKSRQENEAIKAQLEKSQMTVKELEKVNATLQDEFKRAKISQETAQGALEKIRKEHKSLESSLNSVKTENDSLKRRFTQSVKPMIRPDSKHVENINEKCRPSNIALSYNNLESQEWVDAKESLEHMGFDNEEMVIRFLCAVVMTSYTCSTELLSELEATISELLRDPCKSIHRHTTNCVKPLTDDLTNNIKESLRVSFEEIDIETLAGDSNTCIREGVSSNVAFKAGIIGFFIELTDDETDTTGECTNHPDTKTKEKLFENNNWSEFEGVASHKSVLRYVEQCARVTWQMVIQQTPMYLSTTDTQFDDVLHKLWWSCSQSEARKINYFVWPSLYDFKRGNLMVKGCVHAS